LSVLAHSGALYALLDRSDEWHALVKAWWTVARERVVVPSSVLPVTALMVSKRLGARAEAAFIRSVVDGEIPLEPVEQADVSRAAELIGTYQQLPLGFLEASLVAVAERLGSTSILTTERTRLAAVRPSHAERFRLLP
jgi:predicted nucleic acid-binding protein